jgi:hypothetical protein
MGIQVVKTWVFSIGRISLCTIKMTNSKETDLLDNLLTPAAGVLVLGGFQ